MHHVVVKQLLGCMRLSFVTECVTWNAMEIVIHMFKCESDGCVSLRSFLTVMTDQGGVFLPYRGGGGAVGTCGRRRDSPASLTQVFY